MQSTLYTLQSKVTSAYFIYLPTLAYFQTKVIFHLPSMILYLDQNLRHLRTFSQNSLRAVTALH